MLSDAGVADVTVSTAPAFMIGPDAACVIGMAQGIDAAGAPIGYRAQAALLVKDAGTWKIVAQAAGMAEEGTAPQGAFGVPSAP